MSELSRNAHTFREEEDTKLPDKVLSSMRRLAILMSEVDGTPNTPPYAW